MTDTRLLCYNVGVGYRSLRKGTNEDQIMTQKEFWEALARRAKKYGFKQIPFTPGLIRENRSRHCPVVAVALAAGFRKIKRDDYLVAAEKLGLDPLFAKAVADAADGHSFTPLQKVTTKKLLKVIGATK